MTVFKAVRSTENFPISSPSIAGVMCCSYGIIHFPLSNHPQTGDIIEMCRIPAGATIIGGRLCSGQLDQESLAEFEFDMGWADNGVEPASSDGLGNLGEAVAPPFACYKFEEGYMMPLQGDFMRDGPLTFTNKTIIQVTIIAGANNPIAGNMSMMVYFTIDVKVADIPIP